MRIQITDPVVVRPKWENVRAKWEHGKGKGHTMRRGRICIGAAWLLSALAVVGTPGAFAAGGTPQDICGDLADGHVDGNYTQGQWTAFFADPTIQGYGCRGVTPAPPAQNVCVPGQPGQPGMPAAPGTPGATPEQCSTVTPPVSINVVSGAPPATPAAPAAPAATPVAGVAAQRKTIVAKKQPVSATPKVTPARAAVAPVSTTRTKGTLPFTGAELALFAIVGVALIACGLLLRTTARHRSQQQT